MTIKLKIENVDDIKNLKLRINSMKVQLWQFQARTVRELANIIMLKIIQKRMRDATPPYSEKIVISTVISDVKFMSKKKLRIFFHSELFTETGFDIALVREKTGSKDHLVPKGGHMPVGHALRFIDEGIVKFSKGHEVSGIKALHIIHDTLQELAPAVQLQYESRLQHWTSANLKGEAIAIR